MSKGTIQQADTKLTEQYVLNRSFDPEFDVLTTEQLEYDPSGNLKRKVTKDIATKITSLGVDTYIAKAPIGSSQSNSVWQCKKITVEGNDTVITWAGSGQFNQVATDLTALTYE